MRRMLMVLLGAAAILVGGLLVAGCGGSDNDAAETAVATETSTTGTTESGSTSEDEETSTSDEEMTDSVASAAGIGEECQKLVDLGTEFSKALSAAGADGSGEEGLQATADAYEAFAEQAPEEVRDAFRTVAKAFAVYAEALQDVDLSAGETPDPATIAKIAKAAQGLNETGLTEANTQIAAWVTENCSTGG